MNEDLQSLRHEIDKLNIEISELLNTRALLVRKIGNLKDEAEIDYFDATRELEMLEGILNKNGGPLQNELLKEIFMTIFSTSLKFMGINREKRLLISSGQDNGFQSIQKMFNIESNRPIIIAGPCAVEKPQYLEDIAQLLTGNSIKFLRAGAYKPRTSPYEFQGLKKEGLKILSDAGKKHDLITVSEVVDPRDVEMMSEFIDVLQIGARNMHNFELLKEVGQTNKPILLKRGISATINELMYAAEYVGLQGNRKIILCERGIRTYETKTRNTLDISCIPILKKETRLPVLVDLSHSLGRKDIINYIARAALASGADGIMIEVHPFPELALSDSKQQLNPVEFSEMLKFINW